MKTKNCCAPLFLNFVVLFSLGLAVSHAQLDPAGADPFSGGPSVPGLTSNSIPPILVPPPLTEEDLAAAGQLHPTLPTNTPPGSAEQFLNADFQREIVPVVGGASANYGLLKVQFPLQ